MRTVFDVIRVHPDKSTEVIKTVINRSDVTPIVETPQYVGTWINSDRKLLRYGRGEIRVQSRIERQEIVNRATTEVDGQPAYLCDVRHAGKLLWIIISQKYVAGYTSLKGEPLWKVASFTELSSYVDKSLAYECCLAYDTLVAEYQLKAYM